MFAMILPLAVMLVAGSDYRRRRVLAFLNPWSDQYGSGFQMIQSFVAFNEGGWFGRGLGQGQQKLFYLPEAHTDFIFSVIGEELGLVGIMLVIALFGFFCYRGFQIALRAPDLFGRYLAVGCTLLIALEAVLNMGVVMGLLPTKGLALPFLSYGGSSLVVSLAAVGILLNISTYRRTQRAVW
jgi:cell division protein FtsW